MRYIQGGCADSPGGLLLGDGRPLRLDLLVLGHALAEQRLPVGGRADGRVHAQQVLPRLPPNARLDAAPKNARPQRFVIHDAACIPALP